MLTLRTHLPLAALNSFGRELDQLFDNVLASPDRAGGPALNLWDEGAALVAELETPGLKMEDIEVFVHDKVLTLKGQRSVADAENVRYHLQERRAVAFERSLTLPVAVDAEQIEATLKDGVLTLRMPKFAAAQPRKIEIKGL